MSKISTCLWFDNQAEEAAELYVSIFEDSRILNVSRYGDGGPGESGTAMMVDFELFGRPYSALNGGPQFQFSEAISIVVQCENQDEVDEYWKKLTADGGSESQCAWLKDKFGLSWQIVPKQLGELMSDPDPIRSQRVVQAMLGMKKIVISDLQAAYDG